MPRITLTIILLLCLVFHGCKAHQQMLDQLVELDRQNQADSLMTNDSLAITLCKYFDRHGTSNERMRAHYMLARTYSDRGEAPQALEEYMKSIESADTTAADCDFSKLSRVCGQMAQLLFNNNLPRNAISAFKDAYHYSSKAGEGAIAVEYYAQQARCYYELNLTDSVVFISTNAVRLFEEYGDTLSANTEKGPVSYFLAKRGDISEAKTYLDSYEYHSYLNKQTIEKNENWKLLYYYKGVYYQGIAECDSALYYYYKTLYTSKSSNNLSLACQGLFETYSMLNKSDSVAKYSIQYANHIGNSEKTASAAALLSIQHLYDYHSYKSAVESKTIEAMMSKQRTVLLGLILTLSLSVSAFIIYRFRKYIRLVKQRIHAKYTSDIHHYNAIKDALQESQSKIALHEHLAIQAKSDLKDFKKDIENTQNKYLEDDRWGLTDVLQDSSIVQHLREKALRGGKATELEQKKFRNKVTLYLPEALTTLCMQNPDISTKEKLICLFVFAHFSPTEICVLMEMKPANLSNIRKRLNRKLFSSDGGAKEFDEKIQGYSQSYDL